MDQYPAATGVAAPGVVDLGHAAIGSVASRRLSPRHFHLATYKRMPFVQLVHLLKERWRTERVYQDLKGELGLDHFEGRRFRGWHHHVSVALCCFAFLAAERARAFPPSTLGAQDTSSIGLAA